MTEDEEMEEDDETFFKTFYEYDRYGYPLDPETRRRRALLRELWEEESKWTLEECRAYLVKLGTHNPDGTLTEHYADDGEPSKYRPRD
jgi:hypothetical protein